MRSSNIVSQYQEQDRYQLLIKDLPIEERQERYFTAVGEIGFSPNDFYEMTLEEYELAYQGYCRRLENLTNLMLLALNRSKSSHSNELFKLADRPEHDVGTTEERNAVFKTLGIQEGLYGQHL